MAEAVLERRGPDLWTPASKTDGERLARIRVGEGIRVVWKRERTLWRHKKFFALLQLVAEHHPAYDNVEKALVALKVLTGLVDPFPHPQTGEIILQPRSISFQNMGEDEFEEFYERAVQGVLDHLVPGMFEGRQDADAMRDWAAEEISRF